MKNKCPICNGKGYIVQNTPAQAPIWEYHRVYLFGIIPVTIKKKSGLYRPITIVTRVKCSCQ